MPFKNWLQPCSTALAAVCVALAAVAPGSPAARAAASAAPSAAMPFFSLAPGIYGVAQVVSIGDATPGATIYYAITRVLPSRPSVAYTGPITVAASETVNAIAVAPGYSQSAAASAAYTIAAPAATPVFSVAAGTYISSQSVAIADSTPGAVIYFTITGIIPTIPSAAYTGPITVSASETINAVAIAPGFPPSAAAGSSYTITPPAPMPQLLPAGGTYTAPQTVGILSPTPGATIFYTSSGMPPTTSSTPYTGPIALSASQSIRAIAIAPGYSSSPVASGTFNIEGPLNIAIPASLPAGYVGAPYSATIEASGQGPSYTWVVNGAAIPANGEPIAVAGGIAVSNSGNYALLLGGKPTAGGSVLLSVAVTDTYTGSQAGPAAVTIQVASPDLPSLPAPNPATLGPAVMHENYAGTIAVAGGVPPYAWTVTGLPGTMTALASAPISTPAGDGSPGWSGDGGPATQAQIGTSGGVAVDAMGNVFFADSVSSRVRMVTPGGIITTVAGTGTAGYNGDDIPAVSAQLNAPVGLAADRSGNLYIADQGNARIRMVSAATGQITTVAGAGVAGFAGDGLAATIAELNSPTGVAIDCQGNLYIADAGNARIREVYAMTGAISTIAGTGSAGFSGDGGPASVAQLNNPYAIQVDTAGNIYVADLTGAAGSSATGGHIREIDSISGFIRTVAGNGASGFNGDGIAAIEAELSNPVSLAVDRGGNLFIADAGNNRIRMVSPSGIVSTFAGTGVAAFNGDNVAAITADIGDPQGVATDGAGNVYIADGNSRIRFVPASAQGSVLVIKGTPSAPGVFTFQASVTDSTGAVAGPVSYSVPVTAPWPLTLPLPNPASLPAAVAGQPYFGTIVASGGIATYSWMADGGPVAPNGKPIALPGGITVSSNGSNTLSIGGTPTSPGAIALWARVQDGMGHTAGTTVYAVDVVAAPGSQVSGQVGFLNCGAPAAGVTVTLNSSPVQIASTDLNGNFVFANVPNGTYTIVPSVSAPSSTFYPSSQTVSVNGGKVSGASFQAAIGYTVSGSVGYTARVGGRISLSLVNTSCPGATLGTNIAGPQSFSIRGVQPGTYTLQAWVDETGYGALNAVDPVLTIPNVTVGSADLSIDSLAFVQPPPVTLTQAPVIQFAGGFSGGAVLGYAPILSGSEAGLGAGSGAGGGVEQATSYTVEWSTSPTFSSIAGTCTYAATGGNGVRVWLLNGLASRSVYYFRAQGSTAASNSPWSNAVGPVPIGIAAAGNTISGTVSFAGAARGALYVGFRNTVTGQAYAQIILGPVSPQPYSIKVPTGSSYAMFALVDQNGDGMADNGDFNGLNGSPVLAIAGNVTEDLTLPASNVLSIATQHFRVAGPNGVTDSYDLAFNFPTANMVPLAVSLLSGPNVLSPMDIGECVSYAGLPWNFWVALGSAVPNPGDQYSLELIDSVAHPASDPGWNVGATVIVPVAVSAVVNAFAADLTPASGPGAGVTPSFTWADPPNAAGYTYQFALMDANGNVLWQIPGPDSTSSGFSSAITSISWGVDPTGAMNPPAVPALIAGESYIWSIQVRDADGNTAEAPVAFTP